MLIHLYARTCIIVMLVFECVFLSKETKTKCNGNGYHIQSVDMFANSKRTYTQLCTFAQPVMFALNICV